ncbi:MAG: ABC transporter permease subunit [Deltaproteobacteria bacterium]|nr:ABC transporter permease subunit [Deltaproteobacteria bacterium]
MSEKKNSGKKDNKKSEEESVASSEKESVKNKLNNSEISILSSFRIVWLKELKAFFYSPTAYVILSGFVLLTSWLFFDTFWLRNEASSRPLFDALPKIFLLITPLITMKMWADEYASGTQDQLFSLPVSLGVLTTAKLAACITLIAIALVMTLPYPFMAEYYGNLDWGPVIGGYTGALLLGSAYAAIGIFISSLTRTQIEAAFITLFAAGIFYFIGESFFVDKISSQGTLYLLSQIGLGARFRSIARGVFDIRDLVYYLSFTALFIVLNVSVLRYRKWM